VRRTSLLNSRWTGVFVTNSSGVSIVDNQIDRPALQGIEATTASPISSSSATSSLPPGQTPETLRTAKESR
jgi:hypothetical protein